MAPNMLFCLPKIRLGRSNFPLLAEVRKFRVIWNKELYPEGVFQHHLARLELSHLLSNALTCGLFPSLPQTGSWVWGEGCEPSDQHTVVLSAGGEGAELKKT